MPDPRIVVINNRDGSKSSGRTQGNGTPSNNDSGEVTSLALAPVPVRSGGGSSTWTPVWGTGVATSASGLKSASSWGMSATSASVTASASSTVLDSSRAQSTFSNSNGGTTSLVVLPATASGASNAVTPSRTSSRGSPSIGPIVGGSIAAITLVLLLLFLSRYWRRRSSANASVGNNSQGFVTPFNLDQGSSQEVDVRSRNSPTSSTGFNTPILTSMLINPESPTSSTEKTRALADATPSHPNLNVSNFSWDVNGNEKRASGPTHPHTVPELPSELLPSSPSYPQLARHSLFSLRPPSSISPSEVVPAYVRDSSAMSGRHGISAARLADPRTSELLDVPPCYEC